MQIIIISIGSMLSSMSRISRISMIDPHVSDDVKNVNDDVNAGFNDIKNKISINAMMLILSLMQIIIISIGSMISRMSRISRMSMIYLIFLLLMISITSSMLLIIATKQSHSQSWSMVHMIEDGFRNNICFGC